LALAIIALWLAWRRRWRTLVGLGVGALLGLGLWSAWSWRQTGHAFGWFARYQLATAWDARFELLAGRRKAADPSSLVDVARQVYPPLAVTGLALLLGATYARWRGRMADGAGLLAAVVAGHWLVLGLALATNLPGPDPRYLLVTLPALVCLGVLAIASIPRLQTRRVLAGLQAVLLVVALASQLAGFRDKAYVLAPERAAGEALRVPTLSQGNFWVDAPTSIYFSDLPPERFFSSEQLVPHELREQPDVALLALAAMAENAVRLVLWEDVSYTYVGQVWPQMAAGEAFEQDGYRFMPVFSYAGWELEYGAKPTVLWQVESLADRDSDASLTR
jgi:hypothetical protein